MTRCRSRISGGASASPLSGIFHRRLMQLRFALFLPVFFWNSSGRARGLAVLSEACLQLTSRYGWSKAGGSLIKHTRKTQMPIPVVRRLVHFCSLSFSPLALTLRFPTSPPATDDLTPVRFVVLHSEYVSPRPRSLACAEEPHHRE